MDNEEIQGVKFSEFPSQTPGNSDEVVGLHGGDNARFSIANIVAAVRNGLANIFVPKSDVGAVNGVASLDNTGKVPTSQLPSSTGPEPATATPLMDGTGAIGVSTKYAREDHEHPADTNKQDTITANGILKGDGQGGVSAATAGTDYQAPLTAGTDYATPAQLADKANVDELGIVINGDSSTQGAEIRQFVVLRNSTISGCNDGIYKVIKTIPANTPIDATYITAISGGGLNSVIKTMYQGPQTSTSYGTVTLIADPNANVIGASADQGYGVIPYKASWGWGGLLVENISGTIKISPRVSVTVFFSYI